MIQVTLKDGSVKEFENELSVLEIAKSISEGLARAVVAASINDEVVGLDYVVKEDCTLNLFKFDDVEGKDVFRHTSAHMLAQAIKRLYPNAKFAIGPSIENGFYYDIDLEERLTMEDLAKLEAEMKKIAKEDQKLERFELPKEEALAWAKENGEIYKEELINDLPEGEIISFYKQGDFTDLCRGPHLLSTKKVKAVKLLSVAGAYWRGDEKNKMLQRIYGISFEKNKDLEEYLHLLEEAKKRDHRKLGKELDLFFIPEEGPGFPLFLPKGMELKNALLKFWREIHKEDGYVEIETPIILNQKLWETSGHWYNYKENMYTVNIDEELYAIKPMNCPGSLIYYNHKPHSYKEFPMKVAELGRVHRHELSGALHGLMRVRAFTQDDAHIYMLPEQIKEQIKGVVDLIDRVYKTFGFEYHLELSTRPEKSMGTDEEWEVAENGLREALEELNLPYILNEGDGAFYGPKIDFHLRDCIGRTWQCGTIQLDMQNPQRFDITYMGQDGEKHRPVMIHRVAFGSIERFIGILIEQYAGKFPVWLAPTQVKILPISDKYMDYANEVKKALFDAGVRVEMDDRAEKIGFKIREAQLEKVPYMLVVGEKEAAENQVAVRSRDKGEMGSMNLNDFVSVVVKEDEERVNIVEQ
ncbi:threonine--tRNA ligase [Terrisporobacter petrolearius]|uniref:threonine--tRNA ligase n=1 Tax=Terrisporobacter petrolearius TaxID=1460447 RepID=UPI001D16114A|nr:threonine--tRNA ligase [Terrisporobacter petrolearius]MCC3863808.1 threonine--tRNA ligase [Terrisporobacter petrolearius]